jgi:hypothetical protein
MGFMATLLASWLTAHFQGRSDRQIRMLEARLRVYGECSDSLYEYARATYNRAKARLERRSEVERDGYRQEAYRCNARARSAIGQLRILSQDRSLEEELSHVRHDIGGFNDAADETDLRRRQEQMYGRLKAALELARQSIA